MSHISATHHKVVTLEKGLKPFEQNTLLRCISKGKKSTDGLTESKAVSVPIINDAELIERSSELLPILRAEIHSIREGLARKLIVSGSTEITTESINLDACIVDMIANGTSSGRMTTEKMQAWFTENYAESAMEFICKLVRFDMASLSEEQTKVVLNKANSLRDIFAQFASGKFQPAIPVCKMILGFGSFLSDNLDVRMSEILKKTEAAKQEQENELNADMVSLMGLKGFVTE